MSNKGFVAISTVLILSAVIAGVVVTAIYLSIGEGQTALSLTKGEEALNFSEGCVEDALLKSANSATFGDPVGTPVTFTRPEGTCNATMNSKTGTVWDVTVTASGSPAYKRTLRVNFNRISSGLTINSWGEI